MKRAPSRVSRRTFLKNLVQAGACTAALSCTGMIRLSPRPLEVDEETARTLFRLMGE